MSSSSARSVLALLALGFALTACDCDEGAKVGAPCDGPGDCSSGACVDGKCAADDDAFASDGSTDGSIDASTDGAVVIDTSITGISLGGVPAVLEVEIGETNDDLQITVTAQLASGGTSTLSSASFSVDNVSPGFVTNDGRYTANGVIGGPVTVTAAVVAPGGTFSDSATFTVRLVSTRGAGEGPTSPGSLFAENPPVSDASADAEILYPLDGAVMPQNVQPADIQWACASNGAPCADADVFRVTITKPSLLVTQYLRNDDPGANDHFLPDGELWRAIAQTDPDSDATIRVDRYQASASRVVEGAPVSIRFAAAAITGTVYYWDIDEATIRAIDDGSSSSRVLLPHMGGNEVPGEGERGCVGCHSVSPSGRFMLANTHTANYGALFDLTNPDLSTADPTPIEWPGDSSKRWRLSSWSPDETLAMVSTAEGDDALRLLDPFTGDFLDAYDAGGGALTLPDPATMPAWAPDGAAIAYVAGNNSWAGDTTTGHLSTLPVVDAAARRFGAASQLIASGTLLSGLETDGYTGDHGIFYPSFTPDSAWLAFAHGTGSRSDPRDLDDEWLAPPRAHTSALYLARRDGTDIARLTRGCAPSAPEAQPDGAPVEPRRGLDFQPSFAPFEGGGYYWLSFLSRRPYGNRITGNRSASSDHIQQGQIWVMAIRVNADGGVDPSEVAYWLPGQNPEHRIISANWAPRPCRQNGTECGVGSECCSGDCRPPVGGGAAVCSPPPPDQCRLLNETCSTAADCCDAASDPWVGCYGNVCTHVIIGPG